MGQIISTGINHFTLIFSIFLFIKHVHCWYNFFMWHYMDSLEMMKISLREYLWTHGLVIPSSLLRWKQVGKMEWAKQLDF